LDSKLKKKLCDNDIELMWFWVKCYRLLLKLCSWEGKEKLTWRSQDREGDFHIGTSLRMKCLASLCSAVLMNNGCSEQLLEIPFCNNSSTGISQHHYLWRVWQRTKLCLSIVLYQIILNKWAPDVRSSFSTLFVGLKEWQRNFEG
jgi:hypothetical protein